MIISLYDNLSRQFRAFIASLDSTIILRDIYIVLDYLEWKNTVMEEMKALEKNKTWEIWLYPRDTKLWDANGCSLSNTKQMEHLTYTR